MAATPSARNRERGAMPDYIAPPAFPQSQLSSDRNGTPWLDPERAASSAFAALNENDSHCHFGVRRLCEGDAKPCFSASRRDGGLSTYPPGGELGGGHRPVQLRHAAAAPRGLHGALGSVRCARAAR